VVARPFRPTISFAYAALRRMDDPPNAFIDAYVARAREVGRAWAGNS